MAYIYPRNLNDFKPEDYADRHFNEHFENHFRDHFLEGALRLGLLPFGRMPDLDHHSDDSNDIDDEDLSHAEW